MGYDELVGQVFGDLSPVLYRCRIYESMNKVEESFASYLRAVIISVIKLCAHVVKYRQHGLKPKTAERIRAILDQDTHLKTEMETLQDLIQCLDSLEGTVTLYEVLSIGGLVGEMNEGVKVLTDKHDLDKKLDQIRSALGVESTVRLDNRTTQTRMHLSAQCYEGTGSWIWENDQYLKWTSIEKGIYSRVLLLSGPVSSGKTLVSAAITKRLEEQKGGVFVAHYFFSSSGTFEGKQNSGRGQETARNALKYMAFQLARVDSTLRSRLFKALNSGKSVVFNESVNLKELWQQLGIGKSVPATNPVSEVESGSPTTYYLVFDGLEHLPEEQSGALLNLFSSLMAGEEAGSVRILASGNDEIFKERAGTPLRINIAEQNAEDMRICINKKLDEARVLQQTSSNQGQKQALALILEKLPQKSSGSFSALQSELNKTIDLLKARMTVEKLEQSLDESAKSQDLVVQKLQDSLTEGEVLELNELLRWVLFIPEPGIMSWDELEAAMVSCFITMHMLALEVLFWG